MVPTARIPVGPGYQLPLAEQLKRATDMPIMAVGMIAAPSQAEAALAAGQADMIALGRALLDNPRWGWHAAEALGAQVPYPQQYARAAAKLWPGAALARPAA
jgi:2,4-dienoyl-CoA reductase-like NADH-dependent reductase (Old Yellow Enzyme family)